MDSNPIQKQRLLRMTLAHYRQPTVNEEDFHRFVSQEHGPLAARVHQKNGLEAWSLYFSPSSFRQASSELSEKLGANWSVRGHDVHVQFFVRDMDTLVKLASDPDFQALHAAAEAFVNNTDVEVSIGWVETYLQDGRVVNIDGNDRTVYPSFKELSAAP